MSQLNRTSAPIVHVNPGLLAAADPIAAERRRCLVAPNEHAGLAVLPDLVPRERWCGSGAYGHAAVGARVDHVGLESRG